MKDRMAFVMYYGRDLNMNCASLNFVYLSTVCYFNI